MKNIFLIIILLIPVLSFAQLDRYVEKEAEPVQMSQWGMAFSVLEAGTGLGAFYDVPLPGYMHLGATLNGFYLRDSKEFQYGFGDYVLTYNKENNVYLIDLMVTLKKRLFPRSMHDSFQPYISVSAGPVYGMNFPEDDAEKDQTAFALSGAGAFGVNAIIDNVYIFGLRLQYRYMKFDQQLGERQNHSMFDVRIELGKRF